MKFRYYLLSVLLCTTIAVAGADKVSVNSDVVMPTYELETESVGHLYHTSPYGNMKQLLDASYSISYTRWRSYTGMSIAIGPHSLLTAAHVLMPPYDETMPLGVDSVLDNRYFENMFEVKVRYIIHPTPLVDLVIIHTVEQLPSYIDICGKNKPEDNLSLIEAPDYGEIYAIGYKKKLEGYGYAQKLTGKPNFSIQMYEDQYAPLIDKGESQLVLMGLSGSKPDINGGQIDSIPGDSGGPWLICSRKDKYCKLFSIQSWRGVKDHPYRSGSLPLAGLAETSKKFIGTFCSLKDK